VHHPVQHPVRPVQAKNANEMFRIFKKFNALFVRLVEADSIYINQTQTVRHRITGRWAAVGIECRQLSLPQMPDDTCG
jgi:hypothetical protein